MNLVKLMIILSLSMNVFAEKMGSGGSNGGDLSKIDAFEALSLDEIKNYLTVKSHLLKRTGENLINYIPTDSIEDEEVKARMKSIYGNDSTSLMNAIKYANFEILTPEEFKIKCDNPDSSDACTTPMEPGSTIYFNLENINSETVTFAKLSGLFMHEISRQFIGRTGDEDHRLAYYYTNAVQANKHKGRIFKDIKTTIDGTQYVTVYSFEARGSMCLPLVGKVGNCRSNSYLYYLELKPNALQDAAVRFCKIHGYKDAINPSSDFYDTGSIEGEVHVVVPGKKKFEIHSLASDRKQEGYVERFYTLEEVTCIN